MFGFGYAFRYKDAIYMYLYSTSIINDGYLLGSLRIMSDQIQYTFINSER